jgi:uncharacterized membrane protein YdjX (TVP38/TMEM64 family)
MQSAIFRLLATIVTIIVLIALPFFVWGDALESLFTGEGAVDQLTRHGAYAWAVAILLLLSDLALPIPTSAVMAALGIIYGPLTGGALAALGSMLAGVTGYAVCRSFGRPIARLLSGDRALADAERLFEQAGGWMIVLSRWLPVLAEVMACMAGLSRMPFRLFLVALACGSVPLGFAFALIGHIGEERPVLTLGISVVLPALLWLIVRPLLRAIREKSAAPQKG